MYVFIMFAFCLVSSDLETRFVNFMDFFKVISMYVSLSNFGIVSSTAGS